MKTYSSDKFPYLNKTEALEILSTPARDLKISSDYYKAVFCLEKFPGEDTENALLGLIQIVSNDTSIKIAKRKAIEVLAKLKCEKAIPTIFNCLESSDEYIVENAVLALKDLKPNDPLFHNLIISLLDKPQQNKRVLIQALAQLNITKASKKIKSIINDKNNSISIRGAAISAIRKLENDNQYISELEKILYSDNQNNRQSAIEDVINSGSIELIPSVANSPVSPFFRLRAIDSLWPDNQLKIDNINLLQLLDTLIKDEPKDVNIIHLYNDKYSVDFLINQLYSTDFSKSYLALLNLSKFSQDELWPNLYNCLPRLRRDYGAVYFVVILFRLVPEWDKDKLSTIIEFLNSLIDSNWPDFMKFRPAAILTLINVNSYGCLEYIPKWLDPNRTPYWACRYAALIGIESILLKNKFNNFIDKLYLPQSDVHRFVNQKLNQVINTKENLINRQN